MIGGRSGFCRNHAVRGTTELSKMRKNIHFMDHIPDSAWSKRAGACTLEPRQKFPISPSSRLLPLNRTCTGWNGKYDVFLERAIPQLGIWCTGCCVLHASINEYTRAAAAFRIGLTRIVLEGFD